MKKSVGLLVVIFIGIVSFCLSCKGGTNSWRYLVRSANKARQISTTDKKPGNITNYPASIISSEKLKDTLNLTHYKIQVMLTGDTAMYKTITTLSLPDFTPEKQPTSMIVTANYFYKDTSNLIETTTLQYTNFPKNAKHKVL